MRMERTSACKVNLILNILGRRPDGFHELETVMQPVPVHDVLSFERGGEGIQLTCSNRALPTDSGNLVYRAAEQFRASAGITEGVRIHLEKRIPMAAGLGGGSGNAATALVGLNDLFGRPLGAEALTGLAVGLGSDVPFFLQPEAALAVGRGEQVEPLGKLTALRGIWILLIHPGFGVSTPWAYQNLARFPAALNGQPGRAARLVERLRTGTLEEAAGEFYNSLEAPVLEKYPLLALFQEFLRENGAQVALMSGSGSTTFALFQTESEAREVSERVRRKFGNYCWMEVAGL